MTAEPIPAPVPAPEGDPNELESYASSLESAAGRMDVLASSTVRLSADVKSNANWTGTAAEGYSAFTSSLARSTGGTVPHLQQIASSVRQYAGFLRAAKQKVAAYNKAVEAASCLAPGRKRQAALAALAQERVGVEDALQLADEYGDGAAEDVKGSAAGLSIPAASLQVQVQALDAQTAPPPPSGPEATAAPPGWQQRAAEQEKAREWLMGGTPHDDNPHDPKEVDTTDPTKADPGYEDVAP